MRIDLSGMIRSPVPTGVLVSHVGLRRQRENVSRDLIGRQGKNDQNVARGLQTGNLRYMEARVSQGWMAVMTASAATVVGRDVSTILESVEQRLINSPRATDS
jgi:hypothetical protein